MKQIEIYDINKVYFNKDSAVGFVRKNGATRRIYRIAYDYNDNPIDTDKPPKPSVEFFEPSPKIKGSYHLCRFCGGRGCLGCQKERERDKKKNEGK